MGGICLGSWRGDGWGIHGTCGEERAGTEGNAEDLGEAFWIEKDRWRHDKKVVRSVRALGGKAEGDGEFHPCGWSFGELEAVEDLAFDGLVEGEVAGGVCQAGAGDFSCGIWPDADLQIGNFRGFGLGILAKSVGDFRLDLASVAIPLAAGVSALATADEIAATTETVARAGETAPGTVAFNACS